MELSAVSATNLYNGGVSDLYSTHKQVSDVL